MAGGGGWRRGREMKRIAHDDDDDDEVVHDDEGAVDVGGAEAQGSNSSDLGVHHVGIID